MKHVILFSSLLLFFFGCKQADKEGAVLINGKIKGLNNEIAVLVNEEYTFIDTAKIIDGTFKFKVNGAKLSDPRMYFIYIPALGDFNYPKHQNKCDFFLDSKEISLSAAIRDSNIVDIVVTGSPTSKEYHDIFSKLPVESKMNALSDSYNQAFYNYDTDKTEENLAILKQISRKLDSLYIQKRQEIISAIPSYPDSYAMAFIVSNYFISDSLALQEKIINIFSDNIRQSYYLNKIQKKIDIEKKCSVGAVAPDFTLKDSKGVGYTLSSFRGKIVVVDFWASWCGPCKKEIPNILALNKLLKDKGVVFIGVSIDKKRNDWISALSVMNMDYLNLHDDKGTSQTLYQVRSIPHIILIGKDGRIVAKNLRGEEIAKAIKKLMGEK